MDVQQIMDILQIVTIAGSVFLFVGSIGTVMVYILAGILFPNSAMAETTFQLLEQLRHPQARQIMDELDEGRRRTEEELDRLAEHHIIERAREFTASASSMSDSISMDDRW